MRRTPVMNLVAVGALVALAVAVGGTASAFWRVSGTGAGAGSTGTTVAATLTPGTVAGELYPGTGGGSTVRTTASNPNAAPVKISSLVLDTTQGTTGFAVDAAHSGCLTTSFTFTTQNNAGNGWALPANGSLAISMPGALTLAQTAANACQGVVVTVFLRAAP